MSLRRVSEVQGQDQPQFDAEERQTALAVLEGLILKHQAKQSQLRISATAAPAPKPKKTARARARR
jgi:hypothetical protein